MVFPTPAKEDRVCGWRLRYFSTTSLVDIPDL
jgi:hypothetical protein